MSRESGWLKVRSVMPLCKYCVEESRLKVRYRGERAGGTRRLVSGVGKVAEKG